MDLDRKSYVNLIWSYDYNLRMKINYFMNVRNTQVGKYYQFGKHHHTISNYEIDLSNEAVKCTKNEIEIKGKPVGWSNRQYIWLQLGWAHPELTGEWENSPIFCFPDDDHYDKVSLKEITYEKAISLLPKGKPILSTW